MKPGPIDLYCSIDDVFKDVNGLIYALRGCKAENQLPNGLTNSTTYTLGINMIYYGI